jgi:hypothetical protein
MLLVIIKGRFNCYCPWSFEFEFVGSSVHGYFCPRILLSTNSFIFALVLDSGIEEALARGANAFADQTTLIAAGTSYALRCNFAAHKDLICMIGSLYYNQFWCIP